MVSPSRTLLAMGHYGALPDFLTRLSPRFRTPSAAILTSTLVSSVFYATMRFLSEKVLWDTITPLGVMICFYYNISAFASGRYFPRQWFVSPANTFTKLVASLIGGILVGGRKSTRVT